MGRVRPWKPPNSEEEDLDWEASGTGPRPHTRKDEIQTQIGSNPQASCAPPWANFS